MADRYFVYALCNPITCKVFYIGKGCGNRPEAHKYDNRNQIKHKELKAISVHGKKPIVKYIKRYLSEYDALMLERQYIQKFKHRLTNISLGEKTENENQLAYTQSMIDRLIPFEEWAFSEPRTVIDIAYYDYVVKALHHNKEKLLLCQ